ncbi:MAG: HAD-IA family hydrolase [Pseudomonadota bacterium]
MADIRALLFDLDGTFADTAPDLAYALNETLTAFDKQPLPYHRIRPLVSHGGVALIRLGFEMEPGDQGYEERRGYLLKTYEENICRHTVLFEGIQTLIDEAESQRLPWGIITNKPAWLTEPLMQAMGLSGRAGCIISGDTCEYNKPHPQPMLHAAELLNTDPRHCIYIGDARRDIEAGRAAGMLTAAALYGYIEADDPPSNWDADWQIETPRELLQLLS